MKIVVWAALIATIFACGDKDSDDDGDRTGTPSTGTVGEISDTSADGMAAFVKAASYRDWPSRQPAPIDSVAAHASKTRTYFNAAAATAARAGEAQLPAGSVIVKEIFAADGTTLKGQAVMAKLRAGAGGDTWVWYEGFLPDYGNPYYGIGLGTCVGCHASGTDHVRTPVTTLE